MSPLRRVLHPVWMLILVIDVGSEAGISFLCAGIPLRERGDHFRGGA